MHYLPAAQTAFTHQKIYAKIGYFLVETRGMTQKLTDTDEKGRKGVA